MDTAFFLPLIKGLTLAVMVFSLLGLLLPIYPGLVVIWLAALVYGLVAGAFHGAGWFIFALLTLLMLIGSWIDNLIIAAKARQGGASWLSILLAFLAGVIVSAALTPLAGFLAAPGVLFLVEYFRLGRDAAQAWVRFKALVTGWGISLAIRFLIGLGMIGLWLYWVW